MVKNLYWTDIVFPGEIADLRSVGPEGLIIPDGSTAERPSGAINGTIRYNTDTNSTEVYQNGVWVDFTTSGTTGFSNATNLGAGQPILANAVVPNLTFKTLVAGTNVNLVSGVNTITINAPGVGEINTGNNIGTGVGVFDSKVGATLNFQSLSTTTPGEISITPSGGGEINIDFIGSLGEVNSGSNIGGEEEIFESKIGTTLRFRTIRSTGSPIGVVTNGNMIDVSFDSNATLPGNGAVTVPLGTTVQRPGVPVNGMFRYNTTNNEFEGYIGGSWTTFETSSGIFVQISGDTMTGPLIMGGADISINSGANLNMNGGDIIMNGPASDIIMSAGGNILIASGNTVDGRDISADGTILDSINSVNGLITRIGGGTFTTRTITGTTNQITVTNGDAISGNPIIGISPNPIIPGNGALTLPIGTTAQRPVSPTSGMIRVSTSDSVLEYYAGGAWVQVLDSGGGTISGGDLDLGGNNLINVNLVDGRDISADAVVIDNVNTLIDDSGVVAKSGGSLVTRTLSSSMVDSLLGIDLIGGDGSTNIEVGLDITGRTLVPSLDVSDEILVHDVSASQNRKSTIQDISDLVATTGLENIFVSKFGDQFQGRMEALEDITMPDAIAIAYGDPGTTVGASGDFTINGISISVLAGDGPTEVAAAINTDTNIIADGTITAEVVGNIPTLRIFRIDPTPMILADTVNTPLGDLGFTTGTFSNIATVDGRDISADGFVLDSINTSGEFGFTTRTSDSPTFERRTFAPSISLGLEGISVVNGDGIAGNPEIGLDITGLTGSLAVLDDSDEFVVMDFSTGGNDKVSSSTVLSYIRDNTNRSNWRVSQTGFAIVVGTSIIPFTLGSGDFDENGEFDDGTDSVTPIAGTYRMGVYVEVDSGTPAGQYEFQIRRNGVPEGNFGISISDATNRAVGYIDDVFQASGTDAFTVEIVNPTAGASTIAVARFFGNRVF